MIVLKYTFCLLRNKFVSFNFFWLLYFLISLWWLSLHFSFHQKWSKLEAPLQTDAIEAEIKKNSKFSVVDPEWFFSRSDPTFQLVWDPTWIFSNILGINFSFFFPSCTCFWLHIMTRCKLFRNFFTWYNLCFWIEHFCREIIKFYFTFTFFTFTSNSFGIRSYRIRKYYFRIRILLRVSKSAWSGSIIQKSLILQLEGLVLVYGSFCWKKHCRIQRKTWCMEPYAGADYNLALCPLQHK